MTRADTRDRIARLARKDRSDAHHAVSDPCATSRPTPQGHPMLPGIVPRPARALQVSLLSLALLTSGGCAVTTRFDQGERVSRSVGLGVAPPFACDAPGQSIDSRIFGLGVATNGAVLGYARNDVICLPVESCAAIFVIETPAQARAIQQLYPDLPAGCLVGNTILETTTEG